MKVKTVHYIDGYNVEDMSKSDLIAKIAEGEKAIKDLKKVETESTAIAAEIAKIEAFIGEVVAHLDARS